MLRHPPRLATTQTRLIVARAHGTAAPTQSHAVATSTGRLWTLREWKESAVSRNAGAHAAYDDDEVETPPSVLSGFPCITVHARERATTHQRAAMFCTGTAACTDQSFSCIHTFIIASLNHLLVLNPSNGFPTSITFLSHTATMSSKPCHRATTLSSISCGPAASNKREAKSSSAESWTHPGRSAFFLCFYKFYCILLITNCLSQPVARFILEIPS